MDSVAGIIEQIAEHGKRPSAEVRKLVEQKKEKFSGLLTDSGAAYMVAKDLGISIGSESVKRMHVSQLKDGMQNVDLLVRVISVFAPKEFEKNGKKGRLCNLIVADDTGEIRLTLWHDDVKKLEEKKVSRNSVLLLRNCYVKSFNERNQVSLAFNGSFEAEPKGVSFERLPKANIERKKVSGLTEGLNDVNLVARVIRLYPPAEFDRNDRKGRVMNFLVADETGSVRATAWNDLVKQAQSFKENELVEIEGGYTKTGLKGIELHLGWKARIKKAEENAAIPNSSDLLKRQARPAKIVGLQENNELVLVEGKIVSISQGGLYYRICPECSGKVQVLEEGMLCDKCGEVKEPGIRQVVSFRIDDGSAQINAVAYGKQAQKITGLDDKELEKQAKERGRDALVEELQAMNGTKASIIGKAKASSYSNELELRARVLDIGD